MRCSVWRTVMRCGVWQAVECLSWRSHYLLRRRRCSWCAWSWWHRDVPFWAAWVAVMDWLDRGHCRRSAEWWERHPPT